EVITPSMTWVSTVNLLMLCGAKPVFVDVDRETLLMTPEAAEAAITERTRAIIPVHFAGASVELGAFRQLAQRYQLALIEDAAHAVGTCWNNEKIGRRGTAIFSFHPIKNMTTGEGGMICSDDPQLLEHCRQLKFHGLGVDAFNREMQGRSPQAEVLEPGFKCNMTDIAAAIGRVQLRKLDTLNQRRRLLCKLYRELLQDVPELIPLEEPQWTSFHTCHLMIVRVDSSRCSRDRFMAELKERYGIGSGIHFRAIHKQKYYREHAWFKDLHLPNTEWNSDRICSLPLFPDMSEDDVKRVVESSKKVLCSHE
ncbi:MAG: UDP-4-amino-4-deoxy-L-arabinose--oxoglutarate aminotransferase, partial [Lentisphaerae bacterium]